MGSTRIEGRISDSEIHAALQQSRQVNLYDTEIESFRCTVSSINAFQKNRRKRIAEFSVKRKSARGSLESVVFGEYPEMNADTARCVATIIARDQSLSRELDRLSDEAAALQARIRQLQADLGETKRSVETARETRDAAKRDLTKVVACHKTLLKNTGSAKALLEQLQGIRPQVNIIPALDRHDIARIAECAAPIAENPGRKSGVYFLVRGGEIVYVGRSVNVEARLATHIDSPDKDFDSACYLPIDDQRETDIVERFFILALRPEHNRYVPSAFPVEHLSILQRYGFDGENLCVG